MKFLPQFLHLTPSIVAMSATLLLISCENEKTSTQTAPDPVSDVTESTPATQAVAEPGVQKPDPDSVVPAKSGEPVRAEAKGAKEGDGALPVPDVSSPEKKKMEEGKPVAQGNEIATLGGGCFWCTEAVIERLEGVIDVVSGYMGGHVENPTYEQITTKTTGHAEVIQVTFDPTVITFEEILDVFWQAHDPTTLNQQGADKGPQYRSVIFYHSPNQRNIAMQSVKKLNESGAYPDPAVTEISEAAKFWVAEEYHQNYYVQNKDSNPYCRVVISPKLKKLGLE